MSDTAFEAWITELEEDVIQREFGYEPGEFTVYAEMWRGQFEAGLSPRDAFQSALDAFAAERRREEERRAANRARIQAEDAALIKDPTHDQ